jgi:8-amino-7-oxononanoate synthase
MRIPRKKAVAAGTSPLSPNRFLKSDKSCGTGTLPRAFCFCNFLRMGLLDDIFGSALGHREAAHLLRRRRAVRILDAAHLEIDRRRYVNFASNNYLGLTHHPKVVAAARDATASAGFGSGAAPLVTGYTGLHAAAERSIAEWKGTEDAVLLPSGYHANHAAIGALAAGNETRGGVRFLVDKLSHASLLDAVQASGAAFRIFPHNGIAKLSRLLADAPADQVQVVVTESIFSMDGDAADLPALVELKRKHRFILLLDEAHGSGVYGPRGAGYAAELGVRDSVDLSIVTLSKAMGGIGGAVCGSRVGCEAIVNFGRAYLFSTSLPASAAAAAIAAIDVMGEEPERQARLRKLAGNVRAELAGAGLEIPLGDSPIIPIVLGTEAAALGAAERLRDQGMLVVAIRPPTVRRGSSRLRITLSCEHSDEEASSLIEALRELSPV